MGGLGLRDRGDASHLLITSRYRCTAFDGRSGIDANQAEFLLELTDGIEPCDGFLAEVATLGEADGARVAIEFLRDALFEYFGASKRPETGNTGLFVRVVRFKFDARLG